MTDKEILVKFVSWNCKGLNGTLKRNKILTYKQSWSRCRAFTRNTPQKSGPYPLT